MMSVNDKAQRSRLLTPEELGMVVKLHRELRQWSQEQLGELSGLSTRTIQRVEGGKASDLDTRRALARAFEIEDIDAFNKPYVIPTEDELNASKEKFDKENITLQALPLSTGKELASLVELASMDLSTPAFELCREADECFAELVDYFRDYRDCADIYSQRDKFSIYDVLQEHIDALDALGVSLRYATRKMVVKGGVPDAKPMPVTVLYVIAFPRGKEPTEFATPRSMPLRW
ncbi:helix-turn-helix domain-containing protein [Aromatoleum aromaticum]|nr:helix-turn-helix transcriptional regulator [Aromatoleum aromaticum]